MRSLPVSSETEGKDTRKTSSTTKKDIYRHILRQFIMKDEKRELFAKGDYDKNLIY